MQLSFAGQISVMVCFQVLLKKISLTDAAYPEY